MQLMKMTSPKRTLLACCAVSISWLLAACGPSEKTSSAVPESAFTQTRFLDEAPAGTISVHQARAQVEPGKAVAISGLIGGASEPFVDNYAAFVLADPILMFCNEMPEEHCDQPWDACCEDPDKVSANRISVQFVDSQNRIIEAGLKGVGGLKELSEVVVTGTISEDSSPENLNLLAENIFLVSE